jgi:hypothetical protein
MSYETYERVSLNLNEADRSLRDCAVDDSADELGELASRSPSFTLSR